MSSFLGVFPSVILPQLCIAPSGTLIVNTDPHTESGSHWWAIHFQSRFHSSQIFDSYGLPQFIPSIKSFIRRSCYVWEYNSVQLQGPASKSVANIAVSSPWTWTEFILWKNPSEYLLQLPATSWFPKCSSRSLGLYEICEDEGSEVTVEIKSKHTRQISRVTRNAYSSCDYLLCHLNDT